jgi:hypothetical protein
VFVLCLPDERARPDSTAALESFRRASTGSARRVSCSMNARPPPVMRREEAADEAQLSRPPLHPANTVIIADTTHYVAAGTTQKRQSCP